METVQLFVRSVKLIGKFLCSVEFVIRQDWVSGFFNPIIALQMLIFDACELQNRTNKQICPYKTNSHEQRHEQRGLQQIQQSKCHIVTCHFVTLRRFNTFEMMYIYSYINILL